MADGDDRRFWSGLLMVVFFTTALGVGALVVVLYMEHPFSQVTLEQPPSNPPDANPNPAPSGGEPKGAADPNLAKAPAPSTTSATQGAHPSSEPRPDPFAKVTNQYIRTKSSADDFRKEAGKLLDDSKELADKYKKLRDEHAIALKYLQGMADGQLHLALDDDGDLSLDMVYVEPATFQMGRTKQEVTEASVQSPLQHESSFPRHEIRIASGFFMAETEVTNRQYWAFVKARRVEPAVRPGGAAQWPTPDFSDKPADDPVWSKPATHVSWTDAMQFCKWASEKAQVTVRLPTEIEWEYAARGRGALKFARADGKPYHNSPAMHHGPWEVVTDLDDVSWCGVKGMCGNVSEWCLEKYDEHAYEKRARTTPFPYQPHDASLPASLNEPGGPSDQRVLRGGSYTDIDVFCEASTRRWRMQGQGADYIGFRVVVAFRPGDLGLSENAPAKSGQ